MIQEHDELPSRQQLQALMQEAHNHVAVQGDPISPLSFLITLLIILNQMNTLKNIQMLTGLIFPILPFSNRWAGRVGPFPYTLMILWLWVVFQINILFLIKLISLIMECLITYLFVCLDILIQQVAFLLGRQDMPILTVVGTWTFLE